jgi:two-component system sensor histidine kinase BaeS
VALGFVGFVAVVLAVQAVVLLWLLGRASDTVAGRTPHDLAALVASDFSATLGEGPLADPEAYLREHYGNLSRPVAVVMRDGRTCVSQAGYVLPPPLAEMALRRLRMGRRVRPGDGRPPGGPWPPPPEGGSPQPGGEPGPFGSRAGGGRMLGVAPVIHDGQVVATVIVPPAAPLPVLLRQFLPLVALVGAGLLVVATALAALFVFRPAQRRLRALEEAAHQLGAGVLTTRAPEGGTDEVTAVARAFNAMAADLDQRTSQLLAATEARRQLLADVSHELMTPLTAVRGYLETLQMSELQIDAQARARYLDIVSAEVERLERLIGELLDLARLDAGGGTLSLSAVDVPALFGRVIERHERDAHEKGVRLHTAVDPAAASIVADPGRMEQVLQNLAANALRHTPAGGDVSLAADWRDEGVVVQVRDTGEGIAAEHLPRVFDRFYKADEARGAGDRGSGLGLSIAKAIVERHGGRIGVRSEPGRGTVFEIVLPHGRQ